MMRRTIEQIEARRAEVLAIIQLGPTTAKTLCKAMRCNERAMEHVLQHHRLQGRIESVRTIVCRAPCSLWCTPEDAAKLKAKEAKHAEAKAADKARREAETEARRLRREKALDAEIEREAGADVLPIKRVYRPAHECRALILGPVSVFDLGRV